MAAEIYFDFWREPPQPVIVILLIEEGRFGKIHFRSNTLHPCVLTRTFENAHSSLIASERSESKGIDNRNWLTHIHTNLP